ncbi:heterokaryon incompatibility, partial [Clohesyomyces aquaticus]
DFVALSYVWGNSAANLQGIRTQDGRQMLPEYCPQTIEDAITVTKNLGFRFLWVDFFCISRDPETRHCQIAKMDLIYKTAPLTIVAAAGEDSGYGLPGISRPRKKQLECQFGEEVLVSVRLDVLHDLCTSKYSTRAWTYQERLFSERSLVFTDHQIFLE